MKLPSEQNHHQPKSKTQWEQINDNAAGIDLGGGEHWVCVPPDRTDTQCAGIWMFYP
jgi:hypothetical protein